MSQTELALKIIQFQARPNMYLKNYCDNTGTVFTLQLCTPCIHSKQCIAHLLRCLRFVHSYTHCWATTYTRVLYLVSLHNTNKCNKLQWNLRIMDKLGHQLLFTIQRLSFIGGFCQKNLYLYCMSRWCVLFKVSRLGQNNTFTLSYNNNSTISQWLHVLTKYWSNVVSLSWADCNKGFVHRGD